MNKILYALFGLIVCYHVHAKSGNAATVIRINQLGYTTSGTKTAVWCSKGTEGIDSFYIVDINTQKPVYAASAGQPFGAYGPFLQTYRLQFTALNKPGNYVIKAGGAASPQFKIDDYVYKGAADFCLQYMRQQRSGFNPFLKDSCHTHDGFTVYAPVPDGTHIDVVGGWHDATDYLQYSTTSANATYHLLAAYRDFPSVFTDEKQANGLDGKNGIADVLDEAKWGLDWLLKMHPKDDWLFNQLGDDRDHKGMRLPGLDTNFYGRGFERPVYFCTGQPQGLLKYKNRATGVASTAGKFASAFALGSKMFSPVNPSYSSLLSNKAVTAYQLGLQKPGACQTAPGSAPYFYEEDNWTDDMELAAAALTTTNNNTLLNTAYDMALREPVTPWLGKDTAKHYQWYPFINVGHYELAKQLAGTKRDTIVSFYKNGIERVWNKAAHNAFYRGIPFIWCSNNLTTSFAIQCIWYRMLSGDNSYAELEQANVDWLFGCNPWGTSMVYGLPSWGDTPVDPHSSFSHLYNYPINGGLVDGPVYTNIFNNLLGIHLGHEDEYKEFQSNLAVYHDDFGDFSTNEPTMDGTASLIYLLAAKEAQSHNKFIEDEGAVIRVKTNKKFISLVFTADETGEGLPAIINTLNKQNIKASFFFTGRFYRNKQFHPYIKQLLKQGHYLGPHSDMHPLYCDWKKRDSLLITKQAFDADLDNNFQAMYSAGIDASNVHLFIPPYEWYNKAIADWSRQRGLQLFNFSPGTLSNADYTWPQLPNYRSTETIMQSIKNYEAKNGMNGFILLLHAGTDARRKDKFYDRLGALITWAREKGYEFKKIDELIN